MQAVMHTLEMMGRIDELMRIPSQSMFDLFLSVTGDMPPKDRTKRQADSEEKLMESDDEKLTRFVLFSLVFPPSFN